MSGNSCTYLSYRTLAFHSVRCVCMKQLDCYVDCSFYSVFRPLWLTVCNSVAHKTISCIRAFAKQNNLKSCETFQGRCLEIRSIWRVRMWDMSALHLYGFRDDQMYTFVFYLCSPQNCVGTKRAWYIYVPTAMLFPGIFKTYLCYLPLLRYSAIIATHKITV